ncbi:MAG: phytanoyl-CoA dioxygenase family protein [Candidatus Sulfotelmatobacter sp.]|jgi:ectoine hydroxylase-related dioxygenase (phytanoyl-CoA dioxygenase family)
MATTLSNFALVTEGVEASNRLFDFHDERRTLSECPRSIAPHIEELVNDGVTVIPGSVPPTLCDEVLSGFMDFERKNETIFRPYRDEHNHYPRIVNLHMVYKPLFELFRRNVVALAVQDYLFERETALFTSFFYKRGSGFSIHRDTPFFATRPEYLYLGVWVALEDIDLDNGPLMVVKRGHRIPEVDREGIARRLYSDLDAIEPGSNQLWNEYQSEVVRQCEAAGLCSEPVCVRKGDTIMWHPQTPHQGAEIRDFNRTRYSFVMHTTPVGVPVYHLDVFFHPSKAVSCEAPWSYISQDGRQYADTRDVSFGHQRRLPIEEFAI